jgi:hypothetical protein|tara:strand:- start:1026 stop:1613 length:588 start_codon:yes stop_codon:yes gene_type:complete
MSHSIEKIKSTLKGGGARPNLFQVNLTSFPGGADYDSDEFSILCKAAQLPASNIASIDVPFRGRIFKVAGDRTFDTWTVTVINDNDFKIRTAMEAWMQFTGQYADGSGATDPSTYQVNADVVQFARNASALNKVDTTGLAEAKKYRFYGIFPTNISAIDLSYDTGDTIEEFTVEFQVQYWAPGDFGAGETDAGSL